MEDYNTIMLIPVPQLNIINFIGMKNKHEYLVWRQNQGFFTALNRNGELSTWSMLNGKLLYTLNYDDEDDVSAKNIGQYRVYRSADDDFTYTRDAYRLKDRSLCLLRCNKPLPECKKTTHFAGMNFVRCGDIFDEGEDCQLEKDTFKFETYNFKVVQLKTYKDQGKKGIDACTVLFHFDLPLIKNSALQEEFSNKVENSEDEVWNFEKNSVQRLYLSKNTRFLLEVINNEFGIIYSRVDFDQLSPNKAAKDCGQKVQWVVQQKITNWPSQLAEKTSIPFLFSDNFTYRLDVDFKQKKLLIFETCNPKKVYMELP